MLEAGECVCVCRLKNPAPVASTEHLERSRSLMKETAHTRSERLQPRAAAAAPAVTAVILTPHTSRRSMRNTFGCFLIHMLLFLSITVLFKHDRGGIYKHILVDPEVMKQLVTLQPTTETWTDALICIIMLTLCFLPPMAAHFWSRVSAGVYSNTQTGTVIMCIFSISPSATQFA